MNSDGVHSHKMNFDISHLLNSWDYQQGQVVVRKFTGKDGKEKIQLRVDLGLLQMNADGRPDGKIPLGYPSLLEYQLARLEKHRSENNGSDDGFVLQSDDCSKLQIEALQYHHRYICLLQLEEYDSVVRDTVRNLAVFDFVSKYAESPELAWSLEQFRPQLLMMHTRARATRSLHESDFDAAMDEIERGVDSIRDFLLERGRQDLVDQSGELTSLEAWLEEIRSNRPLSRREKLELALNDAVKREDYEKAAEVRDALRNLNGDL